MIFIIGFIVLMLIVLMVKKAFINRIRLNSEYNEIFNSIDKMSYCQLDKMHDELLPLCKQIPIIPYIDDDGNLNFDDLTKRRNEKREELLTPEKQIYGCKTYGDAQDLNQAIVKRLDVLYDMNK